MSDKKKDEKSPDKKVKPVEVEHKAPASASKQSRSKRAENEKRKISDDKRKTPEFNSVVHPKKEKPSDHHKGISRAGAVLLALMATLAGGSIGWVGPSLFKNTAQTEHIQESIRALNAQLDQQGKSFIDLQRKFDAQVQKTKSAETFALGQHDNLQNTMRSMIEESSAGAPVSDIHIQELITPALTDLATTINTRIDVLEASLSKDDQTSTAGSSAIAERLTAIEDERARLSLLSEQVSALQEQVAHLSSQSTPVTGKVSESTFPEPETERIELPDMETSQDHAKALQILIESFPREKMFEAVHAQNRIASKKPSWLQRTLSKHIKVRDEDAPTPIAMILHAETALKDGRIQDAIDGVAKLNPPVRAIASDWVASAKKAVKAR